MRIDNGRLTTLRQKKKICPLVIPIFTITADTTMLLLPFLHLCISHPPAPSFHLTKLTNAYLIIFDYGLMK